MQKLIVSLCTVAALAFITMSIASAQVIPPPMGAQGPPVIYKSKGSYVVAYHCEYVWGSSYRCVEVSAGHDFAPAYGTNSSHIDLSENVNDSDGPDWEWSFRTVGCYGLPRSAVTIARLNSTIAPTVLDADTCWGYGYRTLCTNYGSECTSDLNYRFTGTLTVETNMGSPDSIEESTYVTTKTDFTTGTKTSQDCDSLSAGTSRGGFTVNGKYWEFGVVGDPWAPEERGSGNWNLNRCHSKYGP